MIARFHGRAAFERVARDGSRVRAGALWCTYVLDPLVSPPQVAYAIGRALGPAVTRNLIRRRLRTVIRCIDVPPGLYLIGARPPAAAQSFHELAVDLGRMMTTVNAAARHVTAQDVHVRDAPTGSHHPDPRPRP